MKKIIHLGDSTSHGGKVVSATSRFTVGGIQVARLGDKCTCPKRGHNNCVIVEGDPAWTIDKNFVFNGATTEFHAFNNNYAGNPLSPSLNFTLFGGPAISVPAGFTANGLPVGVQIVGRPRADWSVLQIAHAFEQATGHGKRRPVA